MVVVAVVISVGSSWRIYANVKYSMYLLPHRRESIATKRTQCMTI